VNKDIRSIRAPDESVSLGVIEPLDGSFQTFHVPPLSPQALERGVKDEPAVIYDIFLRGQRTVKGLQGLQESYSKAAVEQAMKVQEMILFFPALGF